ncbi:MAG: SpoIID/LytB domain-containing protein, partial [Bryobacteraceae bacterium]
RQAGETVSLPLEDYVAAVLAGEAGPYTGDALRAVAVAARTYAVRFAGRHRAEGFDFCETTHCQDAQTRGVTDRHRAAAAETEGELLWHNGSPAAAYYTRNCGGRSESAAAVWGEAAPYLVSRADEFCPRQEWDARIAKSDLGSTSLAVIARTPSGRVARVRLGPKPMSAPSLRFAIGRSLGWSLVRSDWWDVRDEGDFLSFHGRGWGHGVGLCQEGAARRNRPYREILAHYYPGTILGLTAQGLGWRHFGGERVDLQATRPEPALLVAADRAADDVESASGLRFAVRPRVHLYPTVATFRDATGEPGWVAASTRAGVVRLQPSARSPQTLKHELAHVLIESRARAGAPLWLREGLARHLAGERARSTDPPPLDDTFARARGQHELRRLHDAALAAVQRRIARDGLAAAIAELVEFNRN